MKKMEQPPEQPTQSSREDSGAVRGSGRSSDTVRNTESPGERSRSDRSRSAQDDLILHDDDEAELDLPR